MKYLQVALDMYDTDEALRILEDVEPYVDIIEVGTPLLIAQGARAVKAVADACHHKMIFADTKVIDAARIVPVPVLDAGASMFSVLGAAKDDTIRAALEFAADHRAKVLVDMRAVRDIRKRGAELVRMGAALLGVHAGHDTRGTTDSMDELRKLDGLQCRKAIAGGIRLDTFEEAARSSADIIICGDGLCSASDRAQAAARMRAVLDHINAEEKADV